VEELPAHGGQDAARPVHHALRFCDINRAAAEATSGAVIKPVLLLPQ
jgi:hypothetical protein